MKKQQVSGKKQAQQVPEPVQSTPTRGSEAVSNPKREIKVDHLIPYQFPKGVSGNPSGRPPDEVKAIGRKIASLKVGHRMTQRERDQAEDLGIPIEDVTLLDQLMLQLANSKNPMKIAMYLERTYGKVPNVNINAEVNASLVTRFKSKFTDAELERIAAGEEALEILLEKLPDAEGADSESFSPDTSITIDADFTE